MDKKIETKLDSIIKELNELEIIIAKDFVDEVDKGKIIPFPSSIHGDLFQSVSIGIRHLLSAQYKLEHEHEEGE